MRLFAVGLLVFMAMVYVATRLAEQRWPVFFGPDGWGAALAYVRVFAEAAMIGAIADWFAIVALFRHPLGLPIPHTAIIPKNQERIGRSLGDFIASNFLSPEALGPKVRKLDVGRVLADWLAEPGHSRLAADRLVAALPPMLEAIHDEHVREFSREAILKGLRGLDLAPLMGRVLSVLVAHRHHQALFDSVIDHAALFLVENRDEIRAKVAVKSKWWVPEWVDEKLFTKIMEGVETALLDMRNPDHRWREDFNRSVETFIGKLMISPEYRASAEQIRETVLSNPLIHEYLDSVWFEMRDRMIADSQSPNSLLRDGIERALLTIGARMREDAGMQAIVDEWVERAALRLLVPNRSQIGMFIAEVVNRWDTRTLVRKLELHVGRDLQYIRINGTLVGGLVGIAIHALSQAAF